MSAVAFFFPFDIMVKPGNLGTPGGKLYFYQSGTTTLAAVYADSGLSVPLENPVECDGAGRIPAVYLDNTKTYRLYALDKSNALLIDRDPYIPGQAPDSAALAPYQAAAAASASASAASAASASTSAAAAASSASGASAAASLALSGASLISLPTGDGAVMPEMYGAVGNGVTNDTAAFQAMAADINAASGGVIELRPGAIYLVGLQTLVADHVWAGQPVLTLSGCSRPLTIRGNGAKLKLANGLKYGVFDSAGNPVTHTLPYLGGDYSYPVPEAVVSIKNCTGKVVVDDIEVDGNDANLTWGGVYGDTGWQVPGDAFWLNNNSGGVVAIGLYGHHLPRDGVIIWGGGDPTNNASPLDGSIMISSRFEYNCRQGMSFVGGQGWTFIGCRFNHTGKSSHESAPGAGVDLEAESGIIRDLKFIECGFVNNSGAGMVCDATNVQKVSFDRSRFVGSTSWAAWVMNLWFHFSDCTFVGPVSTNPALIETPGDPTSGALLFENCIFTDDESMSPTGTIYGFGLSSGGASLKDTRFKRCHFRGGYSTLMGSGYAGMYEDCSFDCGSLGSSWADPNLYGHTVIADISTSKIFQMATPTGAKLGSDITYNGTQQRRGSATWDPPSLADGARATTTINVPLTRFRDMVKVTADATLQGLVLGAYVSTQSSLLGGAGVVTVTLDNFTGGAVNLGSLTIDVALRDRELD